MASGLDSQFREHWEGQWFVTGLSAGFVKRFAFIVLNSQRLGISLLTLDARRLTRPSWKSNVYSGK